MEVAFKEHNELIQIIDSAYHEAAKKMHLSDSEFNILYIMNLYPDGCKQSVLYKESGHTKSTINSALKKMEKNDILCIRPGQGRNTFVALTETGKELLEKSIYPIIEIENEIFHSWTKKEQQEFLQLNRDFTDKLVKKVNEL